MATRRGFLKSIVGTAAVAAVAPALVRRVEVPMPEDEVAAMEEAVASKSKIELFVVGHGKIMQRHQGRWSVAHNWGNAHQPTIAETQAVLDARDG